ncbi:MAG: hypothetical protein A2498_00220 [Lentisphaerae bacterium RIFOXYC12_FULL_60_16]|nr:MAG: hypothetical protein A2498_00220 [Lentisphaerae bacterium RIFOXYC12_FULL_60_16]
MKAGYAKACITPPLGTRMSGFGGRDEQKGVQGIHDDLFVRVLYIEQNGVRSLIAGFDLLFFAREHADRLKGAVGRELDLSPRSILINTSHTHVGPCVDRWGHNAFQAPDYAYLDRVEDAFIAAAREAMGRARHVTLWAGTTLTRVPVSRRKPDGKGGVEWRPYPEGCVCEHLPVTLLMGADRKPECCLFSVSCHPSSIGGYEISADYPGVACAELDKQLGQACSLFLQGAGGDAKPSSVANGRDEVDVAWRSGTWEDVAKAGREVADAVWQIIRNGLTEYRPQLRVAMTEMAWPLESVPDREALSEHVRADNGLRAKVARGQLELLNRWNALPDKAQILAQGIQLAEGIRLVAIEGELVGELGLQIVKAFAKGVTFPLAYSNGTGLYLPNSRMLKEGGYEADSFYEYGFPARLRTGVESCLDDGLVQLKQQGIE